MGIAAVYTTVALRTDADRLARGAVESGLAACVHVQPITSVYRWQGALHDEPEWRLCFKTRAVLAAGLQRWLVERHPYEVPAIWTLAVADADARYADWVDSETARDDRA